MTARIININDLDYRVSPLPIPDALKPKYEGAKVGDIGRRLGATKLGYNVTVLPPGKCAFPAHNHYINEEMFLVLEGQGEVRVGDTTHPIKTGDVIACLTGGPETAHQIHNNSKAELRYLALSTRVSPEIVDYPDSGKFGVLAEMGPDKDGKPKLFRFIGRADKPSDYWEGES